MWPEARARKMTSTVSTANPDPSEVHVGRANQKYPAAKTNPRGTRDRVATRDQLGIAASQQVASRGNDLFRRNLQQAGFGFTVMRKRGLAFRMPQRNRLCAERPSAGGIGRSKQTDNRNFQRRRQMKRSGISADNDARTAYECNELSDSATQLKCVAAAGLNDCEGKLRFLCSSIHQRLDVVCREPFGNFAKSFRRPLLRAPSGARIDNRIAANAEPGDFRICPGLSRAIYGKSRSQQM